MRQPRSWFFIPADSEKKLSKGDSIPADLLILDLEDSVLPENKPAARQLAHDYLSERKRERHQQLWVRINPLDLPGWEADLETVMAARPDGIVVPKARGPNELIVLGEKLATLELRFDLPPGTTRIAPVATETPESLFRLGEYRRVGPRLAGLTWGAEDLAAAVGATTNKDECGNWTEPFRFARSLCLFGAHAAGVQAVDTLFSDFRDGVGLRKSCDAARRDGFSGKLAIHPAQVEIINQAFTPSEGEIQRAQRIVELFEANPGVGALSLDGQMLDLPHLVQARRTLEAAGL